MCVVRCVMMGAIVSIVFLIISIDMLSCPVEYELGAFMIMFLISSTEGNGILNV